MSFCTCFCRSQISHKRNRQQQALETLANINIIHTHDNGQKVRLILFSVRWKNELPERTERYYSVNPDDIRSTFSSECTRDYDKNSTKLNAIEGERQGVSWWRRELSHAPCELRIFREFIGKPQHGNNIQIKRDVLTLTVLWPLY